MTSFSFSRPRQGARPVAKQLGPVTRAIRALRPNEAPTWEVRQALIDAEEREALRALRKRIKAQIDSDLARVDRCLNALDLIDGDADIEQDAGEEAEAAPGYRNLDDEPSLCGLTADSGSKFLCGGLDDGEVCHGDEPEHDEAELSGIGDEEGLAEQLPARHNQLGRYA